jgi:hypothetical protein
MHEKGTTMRAHVQDLLDKPAVIAALGGLLVLAIITGTSIACYLAFG